jgi:hypothetical protein
VLDEFKCHDRERKDVEDSGLSLDVIVMERFDMTFEDAVARSDANTPSIFDAHAGAISASLRRLLLEDVPKALLVHEDLLSRNVVLSRPSAHHLEWRTRLIDFFGAHIAGESQRASILADTSAFLASLHIPLPLRPPQCTIRSLL